jgi:acetyl-CoA carboxylase carboxyltransferase component
MVNPVCIFAQDLPWPVALWDDACTEDHKNNGSRLKMRVPLIGINDSGGARRSRKALIPSPVTEDICP